MTKTEILAKMDTKKELLNELLDDNLNEAVTLWNEYSDQNKYQENKIYPMSFIDEFFGFELRPSILLNRIDFDSYNVNDEVFWDSIYGVQSGDKKTAIEKNTDKESLAKFFVEDHEHLVSALNISGDLADWSEEYAELENELEDSED